MFNGFPIPKPDSGGGKIKIQHGLISLFTGTQIINQAIDTVDMSKTILLLDYCPPGLGFSSTSSAVPMLEFVDNSNIKFTKQAIISNVNTLAHWYAVTSDSIKKIQRGVRILTASTYNITVDTVDDINKCLFAVSFNTENVGGNMDLEFRVRLTSATNLEISFANSFARSIAWQIAQF